MSPVYRHKGSFLCLSLELPARGVFLYPGYLWKVLCQMSIDKQETFSPEPLDKQPRHTGVCAQEW